MTAQSQFVNAHGQRGHLKIEHLPQHNASIWDHPGAGVILLDRFARVRARASPMTGRVYTPAILYERIWPYNMGLIIGSFKGRLELTRYKLSDLNI